MEKYQAQLLDVERILHLIIRKSSSMNVVPGLTGKLGRLHLKLVVFFLSTESDNVQRVVGNLVTSVKATV